MKEIYIKEYRAEINEATIDYISKLANRLNYIVNNYRSGFLINDKTPYNVKEENLRKYNDLIIKCRNEM
jgi:hypothetical protein